MPLASKLTSVVQTVVGALQAQGVAVVTMPPTERRDYACVYAGVIDMDDEMETSGVYRAQIMVVGYTRNYTDAMTRYEAAAEQAATQLAIDGHALWMQSLSYTLDPSVMTASRAEPWYAIEMTLETLLYYA